MDHGVVIVGAGAAGATTAGGLRRGGYPGRIVIVHAEQARPYNRTAVNKTLLEGVVSAEALTLPEAATPGVEWINDRVAGVDLSRRTVTLTDGAPLPFGQLVIATGSSPRPFPGAADAGTRERLLTLRTAADTAQLRQWCPGPGSAGVTILGAGLIGGETASVLNAAGVPVQLVSLTPPMAGRLGSITDQHLSRLHEQNVESRFGHTVTEARLDRRGRVVATLSSGEEFSSDAILVSIGVRPAVEWLDGAGLDVSDGVAVDDRLRAHGVDGVYAAGDVARVVDDKGRGCRVEHWNHAIAHGRHAALTLLHDLGLSGDPGGFKELPTYSTRVHGVRLTIVGSPAVVAAETLINGDPDNGSFTVALTDADQRLVGVVGVGSAKLANSLKAAVAANEPLDAALALNRG